MRMLGGAAVCGVAVQEQFAPRHARSDGGIGAGRREGEGGYSAGTGKQRRTPSRRLTAMSSAPSVTRATASGAAGSPENAIDEVEPPLHAGVENRGAGEEGGGVLMGLLQGFGQDWMQQDLFGLAKGWGAGAGVIVGGEGKGRDEDFRMDSVRHLGVECAFGLYAYMRRCIHAHIHTRTHTYLHAFAFTQTPCLSVFVFLSLPPSHPPLFCFCLCVSLFVSFSI